jgi:hypothetical protein
MTSGLDEPFSPGQIALTNYKQTRKRELSTAAPDPNPKKNENSEENTAKITENGQKLHSDGKILVSDGHNGQELNSECKTPNSVPKNGQELNSECKTSNSVPKNGQELDSDGNSPDSMPNHGQELHSDCKIPDSSTKNGQELNPEGKITNPHLKNAEYNFDQDYEYLRPPLYAMTLKKKDILSKQISIINSGLITTRQIYHDHSTYTLVEISDLTYWKQKVLLASRGAPLSSFWSDAEIFRMVDSPYKAKREQPHMAKEDLYRGYSRMDLIFLLESWVCELTWEMTDLEELRFLFNGQVAIVGRDLTYNPVIYLNLTGIDIANAKSYGKLLSKVLAVARTYMCVPTKIETMWVILDTNYSNHIIKNLSAIHVALKPLEYLQSIISQVAWARPPKNFAFLYSFATQLGYLDEEASHKFDI